jgi:glucose-induced degradation protein 8
MSAAIYQPCYCNDDHASCAESTVALVAFSDPSQCPVGNLLAMAQRQRTANELNAAILEKFDQEQEPRLTSMLKILTWGQEKLAAKVDFPRVC